MRLSDLGADFYDHGGEDVFDACGGPVPKRRGVGVMLHCPCGCDQLLAVAFKNPLDGGGPVCSPGEPLWDRAGDTIETLTLRPSILRSKSKGGCGWHGFITAGGVRSC